MNIAVTQTSLSELDADLLLVLCTEEERAPALDGLSDLLGAARKAVAEDFEAEKGETLLVYPEEGKVRRVGFVGLGAEADLGAERLRQAAAKGAKLTFEREAETVVLLLPETGQDTATVAQALVEGFRLAAYRFRRYKTEGDDAFAGPEQLLLRTGEALHEAAARGAERGRIVAEAVCSARDLVNRSPDEKTARRFADAILASGEASGYAVEIWDMTRIEDEEMGGLLAVNRGSEEPPTFSILRWKPEGAVNERPIVLVGKGIVFDTGGLSLKPTKNSMDQMKADMAGAAAVVGAFEALARLELPLHVIGLIPATDNRPGKNAYVPGDVVRMHAGTTVEVLNTDAEGRLILADALSYARRYDPELAIDLATLTGAQVVALGSEAAAVMTSEGDGASERLKALQRAGEKSGDRVHPLPMYAEYAELLESDVADLKNVGGKEAGAITAGKFLEHFTDYPWVHLDIAGPAFLQKEKPYRLKGGTGFGVRLLVAFLEDYAAERRES